MERPWVLVALAMIVFLGVYTIWSGYLDFDSKPIGTVSLTIGLDGENAEFPAEEVTRLSDIGGILLCFGVLTLLMAFGTLEARRLKREETRRAANAPRDAG